MPKFTKEMNAQRRLERLALKAEPKGMSATQEAQAEKEPLLVFEKPEVKDANPTPRISQQEQIPVKQVQVNATSTDTSPRNVKIIANPKFSWKEGFRITLRNHDGKHRLIDTKGNEIQVYAITVPVVALDMNKERDRLIKECAETHPAYYLNRTADPMYKIVDEAEETDELILSFEETTECAWLLKDMTTDELISFARLFSINPDKMSLQRVKADLYKVATEQPKTIINMYHDQNRKLRELFRKATHRKVIENKSGVFQWKGYILGGNVEEAINWLDQHEDLVHVINTQAEAVQIK